MVANTERHRRQLVNESGFTLVEFLIASLILAIVLGGTVTLATRVQQGYQFQLDDAVVEQEARYALDWIARDLRSADSDPYGVVPAALGVIIDPNGGAAADDSIRVQADIGGNGPDGDIGDAGENITIALDAVNSVITRTDTNAAAAAVPMSQLYVSRCVAHCDRHAGAGRLHSGAGHGAVTRPQSGGRIHHRHARNGSPGADAVTTYDYYTFYTFVGRRTCG
jgi:prepilin-type N-terminal cleavage/methylation domain-containing protein